MRIEDRKRLARLRLRARRRRDGELRRRAVLLSLCLFALIWTAVFAQMVSGHDPVLGHATRAAATRQAADRAKRQRADSSPQPKVLAIDPETGEIQEVGGASDQAGAGSQPAPAPAAPAPAPAAPAPVTTSQS